MWANVNFHARLNALFALAALLAVSVPARAGAIARVPPLIGSQAGCTAGGRSRARSQTVKRPLHGSRPGSHSRPVRIIPQVRWPVRPLANRLVVRPRARRSRAGARTAGW
jgi:hypothetical protein